ncbi:hypothetical protein Stsp02_18860 [Streptomyces sp. NBRC 14336]|nr:hypothetical protein Stsp02_18860 [Streptomyces sp. NBRC 14336]
MSCQWWLSRIRLSVARVTLGRMPYDGDDATAPRIDWDAAAATFDDEPDHGLRDL